MNIEEQRKCIFSQNRLHIFKTEKNIYLYDAFSQNIFPVKKLVADYLISENGIPYLDEEEKLIRDTVEYLYKWNGSIKYADLSETHLTINLSSYVLRK